MQAHAAARMTSWRRAWVALALAIALHVADETLTDFLPAYNTLVEAIRSRAAWAPLPTFTFPVWLGGLVVGVLVLLALTPLVARGARGMRVVSLALGVLMTANALGHAAASLYLGRPAPGVYSSPLLLAAAVVLVVTASRAGTGPRVNGGDA
jgi:hypothetical protein